MVLIHPIESEFDRVQHIGDQLLRLLNLPGAFPKIGLVLGSGLGPLTESLVDSVGVPYDRIESMPRPKVEGHSGQFLVGNLEGVPIACLSGRVHLYEGHEPDDVVLGVRLLAHLGAEVVILTNAAGGIGSTCNPGTLMVISDHLNLTGKNPLLGPNESRWGPRFLDMSAAYDPDLRTICREVADSLAIELAEGVYAGLLGPTYETPAEVRMLATCGADAVGMSTVLETIALRHRGTRVLGISCITNHAAGRSSSPLSHEEVGQVAQKASAAFSRLVAGVVRRLGSS